MVEQAAHNRCVAGSSPASATPHKGASAPIRQEGPVASKSSDVRPKITMACEECKNRNYITKKNRRNDPDRLEVSKFCPACNKHTLHKETR